MAIKKTLNLSSGFDAEYLQLAHIQHHKGGEVHVTFNLFKNKAARDAGKDPVIQKVFSVTMPDRALRDIYSAVQDSIGGEEV
jgi:hypothetical protein